MIDVVAGHGLDDGPEGHGAALGVSGGAVAVGFVDGGEEFQVPVAGSGEERERRGEVVGGVTPGPVLLVEGLNDGVLFAEGLAETEAEDELAVGEVGDDLADAPFTEGGLCVGLGRGERLGKDAETVCGRSNDREWVSFVEEFGVRIEIHEVNVSRIKMQLFAVFGMDFSSGRRGREPRCSVKTYGISHRQRSPEFIGFLQAHTHPSSDVGEEF